MRERVELLVGRATRAMWVMTFHAACARMLRADADKLGYTRQFTIYDSADQRRLIKRCLDDLGRRRQALHARARCSPRSPTPRTSCARPRTTASSSAPSSSRPSPTSTSTTSASSTAPTRWTSTTCSSAPSTCSSSSRRSATATRAPSAGCMVDEYQDTNHVQYRWLQLLTSEHRNLAVVGDDAQCLVAGTPITMGDGSTSRSRRCEAGDEVLSCYGSGDFRPARVTETFESARAMGVEITTARAGASSARPSTPISPGITAGHTPQQHLTYLMWRRDKGFRVGTTRTRPTASTRRRTGCRSVVAGARGRRLGALDARDRGQARAAEQIYALEYGIPTLPFVARPGGSMNGLVHDQALIDSVFARDRHRTRTACGCCEDERPRLRGAASRPAVVRGPPPQRDAHAVRRPPRPAADARASRSAGATRRPASASTRPGFNVRPAKRGSASWRYESCFSDFGRARGHRRARSGWRSAASLRPVARLGGEVAAVLPAASVRPGMVMFTEDGELRRRRDRRARPARRAGLRPQRRGHPQLRRRRARHPQLDLRRSAARTSRTSSTSATTTRTPTSSSWSRTTAPRRRSSTPPTG